MHTPYPPKPAKSLSYSLSGKPFRVKKEPKPLKRTPISPIGAKKRLRLATGGSEVDMFLSVWNSRSRYCEICGQSVRDAFIYDPAKGDRLVKPQCFAHKLAKGLYPKYRTLEANIALVCSFECHKKIDEKYQTVLSRVELEKTYESSIS